MMKFLQDTEVFGPLLMFFIVIVLPLTILCVTVYGVTRAVFGSHTFSEREQIIYPEVPYHVGNQKGVHW